MTEPSLVAADALAGRSIALSVSESPDLSRLGLLPAHCRVAVAEAARAVFLAGGNVVYGGNLDPEGFTWVLLHEALDYGSARGALTLVLAHSVHREFDDDSLKEVKDRIGVAGELVFLDPDGEETTMSRRSRGPVRPAAGLSRMRELVTQMTDARMLVGGKLRGYQGELPGVVEEALASLRARRPLYVAAGFGGAACAVARWLGQATFEDWPEDVPEGWRDDALAGAAVQIAELASGRAETGLGEDELTRLSVTHRAGDIASLLTTGTARILGPPADA